MKKNLSLLLIFLLSEVLVAGNILGVIKDKASSEAIPGAAVFFPELNRGTSTDKDGKFTFTGIPSGSHKIHVSFLGYESFITTVIIKEQDLFKEIFLEKSAISFKEIVISAGSATSKEETPLKIESLNVSEINRAGETNLMSALTQVPGVDQISFGPGISKPIIRGMSFSRILTVYQGSRFENQQWGEDHGLGLNDPGIERVEIIKGPASLLYGSGALGGVINLIDESPAEPGKTEGVVDMQFHSNTLGARTGIGAKGTSKNGLSWGIRGANISHTDYLDGTGRPVGNSRFSSQTVKLFAGINKNWGSTKITYSYSKQNLGIIEEDEMVETLATTRFDRAMQLPFQDVADHFVSSQTIIPLKKGLLKANLGHHLNLRKEIEDKFDEPDLGLRLSTTTWDLKMIYPLSQSTEYVIGTQGFFQQNFNMEDANEILLPDAVALDYSAYGLVTIGKERLKLQSGLRFDQRQTTANVLNLPGFVLPGSPESGMISRSFSGFSGSVGASWIYSKKLNFKTNLASGFRAPDLAELFSNGQHPGTNRFERGNVNFGRETNLQADAGFTYSGINFSFESAVFFNRINNFIFFSPTAETMDDLIIWEFRQDDVTMRGGELGFNIHPEKLKWVTYKVNMSYVFAETIADNHPIPQIPPLSVNHQLRFGLPSFKKTDHNYIVMKARMVSAQFRTAEDEPETPGFVILSAGAGTEVILNNKRLDLSLTGNNLTNTVYFEHMAVTRQFGVFNMGRNISLNMKFSF
jgi:iron complex outermembrane recepter protein